MGVPPGSVRVFLLISAGFSVIMEKNREVGSMSNLTKNAIKETFLSLLDQRPLSQITVKLIVETCGINRNSFYYHYQDLPALMEEIFQEEADRIIRAYPTVDSVEMALNAAIDFAASHRRAILHIYNSVNRDIFERYLWQVCDHVVADYGRTLVSDAVPAADREAVRDFYRCACFGIVIAWLNDKMSTDIREEIARFCRLHHGMAEEMLRRSAEW